MARLLLVLLIALLPLRGWASESMATPMVTGGIAGLSAPSHAGHARAPEVGHHATTALHPDASPCAGHGASVDAGDRVTVQADCGHCAFCQSCHSPALAVGIDAPPRLHPVSPRPAAEPAAFSSVAPVPRLRPPIA